MIPWPSPAQPLADWADSLHLLRPDFDVQPRMEDEGQWQDWASRLLQSGVLQTANAPRPDGFMDWRSWAEALIKSLGQSA